MYWLRFTIGCALLALGLQTILSGQPSSPSDRARLIVEQALARAAWNKDQDWAGQYRSHMTREVRRFDKDGTVIEQDHGDFEVVPVEGLPFERRLTINGRPLSDEERGWEDEREAEFRENIIQTRSTEREVEDEVEEIAFNDELIGRYVFTLEEEGELRRRPTYRVSFKPRSQNLPVRRRIDYALNNAQGTIWIDSETHEAARIEFQLIERVRLWWGVLGSILQARGSLARRPTLTAPNHQVWVRVQFETYTDTRTLFKRARRAEFRQWTDFNWLNNGGPHQ